MVISYTKIGKTYNFVSGYLLEFNLIAKTILHQHVLTLIGSFTKQIRSFTKILLFYFQLLLLGYCILLLPTINQLRILWGEPI